MKTARSSLSAALACVAMMTVYPATAQTPWLEYGILNKSDSQHCVTLQADPARPAATASVGLQACAIEAVQGSQAWGWIKVDRKGAKGVDTYAFQNVLAKTCIAVEAGSKSNRARLVAAPCNFSDTSQLWLPSSQLRPITTDPGAATTTSKWVNLKSRKCIDVGESSELRQWTCQWSSAYWPQEFKAP